MLFANQSLGHTSLSSSGHGYLHFESVLPSERIWSLFKSHCTI